MAGGPDAKQFAGDGYETSPQQRLTGRLREPQDDQREQKSERHPESREPTRKITHGHDLRL